MQQGAERQLSEINKRYGCTKGTCIQNFSTFKGLFQQVLHALCSGSADTETMASIQNLIQPSLLEAHTHTESTSRCQRKEEPNRGPRQGPLTNK